MLKEGGKVGSEKVNLFAPDLVPTYRTSVMQKLEDKNGWKYINAELGGSNEHIFELLSLISQ